VRIATWNVNSLNVRLGRVEDWVGYAQPDVLCMQETKVADVAFPSLAFTRLGYEAAHHGSGRWNGVAIASRVGLEDVEAGFAKGEAPELADSRILTATCGGVRITTVYVPNGRSVGSEQYQAKLSFLGHLRRHLDLEGASGGATPASGLPALVCGDFNVAPLDRDVWDPAAFVGATHVSEAERQALQEVEAFGLVDAFRLQYDQDRLYSWWDYRAGDFHEHRGMRIDLILVAEALASRVRFALIDRFARRGRQPSDHSPVLVDLAD
jgi:exodeoxyribonuclease-3